MCGGTVHDDFIANLTDRPVRRSTSRSPCCTQMSMVTVINWWPMTATNLPHRPFST